ncbi:MAG: alcohol dehydrogenase catalytic domain-containing protein [Candidatus Wildermuthbacteria bacterium]|nr:alcohol dehydrogenase catalytic domain-containing protein [Candidatus Wildermuthbacteria bacterium]
MKTLPKKQKALVLDIKKHPWKTSTGYEQVQVQVPLLDEKKNPQDAFSALIEVKYAGICGTDRGIWKRQVFKDLIHNSLKAERKTQRIAGHEFTGKVLDIGSDVEHVHGIKKGDTVSGDSHITCGKCFFCNMGQEEICQDQAIMGIGIDGVFAQYIKIPAKNLWPVEYSRIRPEVAAMMDPFGNAIHACSKVNLQGKTVAVLGSGPIGMFTILLANAFGASYVLAADVNEKNLAMAKKLGAHETVLLESKDSFTADEKLVNFAKKKTQGRGVDIAFEMAGPNSSVNSALAITRSGGDVILFGLKDGDFTIPKFKDVIVKGLNVYGVIGRQIFQTWHTSEQMLANQENGIQEKIWDIILQGGKETMIPFESFSKQLVEKQMELHPKLIFKM